MMLTITLFNVIYTVSTVILHFHGHPNVLKCLQSTDSEVVPCNIPRTATSFNYVVGLLITKAVILPIALLIELVVAVYVARGSCNGTSRFMVLVQTFVIWQLFAFIQITVGLISIPWLVLTFISPVCALISSVGIILICILIIFILTTMPIPKFQKTYYKEFLLSISGFMAIEILVLVGLVYSAFITYYLIVNNGMNMDGVKGYIISLIPTVPISIFVWIIKKKFIEERISNKKKHTRNKGEINEGLSKTRNLPIEEVMTNLVSNSEESD